MNNTEIFLTGVVDPHPGNATRYDHGDMLITAFVCLIVVAGYARDRRCSPAYGHPPPDN